MSLKLFMKRFLKVIWLSSCLTLLASQCSTSPMPPFPVAPPPEASVQIALLTPNSGEEITIGRTLRNGIFMAFDKRNLANGLLGKQIDEQIYDTGCDFDQAQAATQQAIDDGIQLMIGPVCSIAAVAAAEVAQANNALLISPTATHPLVTIDRQGVTRPMIFRMSYDNLQQGRAMAEFAYQHLAGKRAALFVSPTDDRASQLIEGFTQHFTAQGGDVVYQAQATPNASDFATTLANLVSAKPDIIYLPASPDLSNQIVSQLNEVGALDVASLLGSDVWAYGNLDPAVMQGSYYPTHFTGLDNDPTIQQWVEAYQSTYASQPDTLSTLGYDTALVLLEAIDRAGTFDPDQISHTLENDEFTTVTGPVSFDSHHNPHQPIPIIQIGLDGPQFVTKVLP
ncbi:MAG: penicillin-binding protein activator [Chloroflexota bacterium]